MKKIKQLITKVCRKLLWWASKDEIYAIQKARTDFVREFLFEILPTIDASWEGKAIIEGGTYNYFELPSGKLPYYDFVIPEVPLYVVVPGIISADWPQAQNFGISRGDWEEAQRDLDCIRSETPNLATINMAAKPCILVFEWNQPMNYLQLVERIQEVLNDA